MSLSFNALTTGRPRLNLNDDIPVRRFTARNQLNATRPILTFGFCISKPSLVEPNLGEEPAGWAGEQGDGGQPSAAAWEAGEAGLGPEYHSSPAGPSTAGYDDAHFSQVSSPLAEGAVEFGGYADERAEYVDGGDGGEAAGEYNADDYDDGDDDDDGQTVVGPTVKRLVVTIKKNRLSKKLYFVDAKGNDRTTSREEWRKVEGGYELGGRKHVYFTKKFP